MLSEHARRRIVVAVGVALAAMLLRLSGLVHGHLDRLLAILTAYAGFIGALGLIDARAGRASRLTTHAALLSDLALMFALSLTLLAPDHYYRILIFSFAILYFAESRFGGMHGAAVLAAVLLAYPAVVYEANLRGSRLSGTDQAFWLALFGVGSVFMIARIRRNRRRLERIVRLFERAGEGDFWEARDIDTCIETDAIARVESAYDSLRTKLANMVLGDPLTGCFNRRGLDQAIMREIARSTRAGTRFSIIAIDIDGFKSVNDRDGHLAGDAILREFGSLLVETGRAGDMVARTGGDEFVILLPDTDSSGAYHAATRLCATVRARPFLVNGRTIHLTISAGVVSSGDADDPELAARMTAWADEALYAAKRAGRDRVAVFGTEMSAVG